MGWQRLGEEEHLAKTGESVTFSPGEFHRFWNAGKDTLICTGYVRPPDNVEYFLTQIYASMRANGKPRPRLFDAAYLLSRYRSEFGMAEPARPVQRVVFPIVLFFGRLLGLHRRFADAPERVRR
jgi:hypothetical protein